MLLDVAGGAAASGGRLASSTRSTGLFLLTTSTFWGIYDVPDIENTAAGTAAGRGDLFSRIVIKQRKNIITSSDYCYEGN